MIRKILFLLILLSSTAYSQSKHTLNGYIKDGITGEALIGATIQLKSTSEGTITNVYGFYSISLQPGVYEIEYSYIGYTRLIRSVDLNQDQRIDIELNPVAEQLAEVVIRGDEEGVKPQNIEMSTMKMDIKTITKIPAFLGEPDIVKSLQMIPGVSTVGEGASGFNVRGGTVGQNLLLLDEAPIYNSSHMLGFFSAFNPDAVKDVKLYKGGIPARYGGRLSSILDVRMKEGNKKKLSVQGGVGTVFSRIALEAPIVKDKGSFIVAGRRSYIDVLAAPFLDDFSLNFYDLTTKANYTINERNNVYLSGYFGRDYFGFGGGQGISWGSQTGTFRWNHLFSKKIFANISAIYGRYDYKLAFGDTERDKFKWNSNITNYNIKPELSFFINSSNEITVGGDFIRYSFDPATTSGVSAGQAFENKVADKFTDEYAAHVSHNVKFGTAEVEYGLRLSSFRYFGKGVAYTYNDTIPGKRRTIIAQQEYDRGETIQTYTNLEPRFAVKFGLTEYSSIKASYNRTVQYIHLVSNTIASNPLDIWTPSTNNIKPQIGDQIAIGYFRNLASNKWEFSIEGYYRRMQNQIDYINGADLLINPFLEGELLSGAGRAYGAEFYLKRNVGKVTGWISYTLSKSEVKVEGINNFNWYPTLFDQTNNLKIAGFYDINSRWSVSANFVYTTGAPTTTPTSKSYFQGIAIPYNANNERNNYRLTDYHRLDIAFRLDGKTVNKKGVARKNRDYWVFSFYNVYARRNAFLVDFKQTDSRFAANEVIMTQALRTSILGSIVPGISYNFQF